MLADRGVRGRVPGRPPAQAASELLLEEELAVEEESFDDFASLLLSEAPVDLDAELSPSDFTTFFCLSFLKSVSYQPLPFRRNAGADSNFFTVPSAHRRQSVSGASLNFWMASKMPSHFSHWYS